MFRYPYPMMGPPIQPPPMTGSFGMAGPSRAMIPASHAVPFSAGTPGTITNIIPSIQKFAGVAQTVTPMVRQYYPLVKQLPALWKILSASKSNNQPSLPSAEDSESHLSSSSKIDLSSDKEFYPAPVHPSTSYFSEAPPPKLYI